jgi:hypothetical protein
MTLLPDITIEISANTVAWYAAIVSTVGLAATLYNMWKDRLQLRVRVSPNMALMNMPQYDPAKTYVDISVINRGRRPATISTIVLKLYRTKGYVVVSDTLFPHFRRLLNEDQPRTSAFLDQELFDPSRIEYVLVNLESGDMHISYQKLGARLRRFIQRWIKKIDNRDAPAPGPR